MPSSQFTSLSSRKIVTFRAQVHRLVHSIFIQAKHILNSSKPNVLKGRRLVKKKNFLCRTCWQTITGFRSMVYLGLFAPLSFFPARGTLFIRFFLINCKLLAFSWSSCPEKVEGDESIDRLVLISLYWNWVRQWRRRKRGLQEKRHMSGHTRKNRKTRSTEPLLMRRSKLRREHECFFVSRALHYGSDSLPISSMPRYRCTSVTCRQTSHLKNKKFSILDSTCAWWPNKTCVEDNISYTLNMCRSRWRRALSAVQRSTGLIVASRRIFVCMAWGCVAVSSSNCHVRTNQECVMLSAWLCKHLNFVSNCSQHHVVKQKSANDALSLTLWAK